MEEHPCFWFLYKHCITVYMHFYYQLLFS